VIHSCNQETNKTNSEKEEHCKRSEDDQRSPYVMSTLKDWCFNHSHVL